MSEFSPSALESVLLKTKFAPTETEVLGTEVYLRRLTAVEPIDRGDALIEAQTSDNARMVSKLSVQVAINNLVHPDGSPIKAKDKPTVRELLVAHDSVVLLDVIDKMKKHAIGKLETAEKD